jgi:ethanolamine utilization protein EutN
MFLARVIGQVVSSKKDEAMQGRKLLMLRPQLVDESDPATLRPGSNTIVAVDSIGAGVGELVLFVQGSSARKVKGLSPCPVDAAVTGIVDTVDVLGRKIYNSTDG